MKKVNTEVLWLMLGGEGIATCMVSSFTRSPCCRCYHFIKTLNHSSEDRFLGSEFHFFFSTEI